ncbi:MAG: hypothetical protein AAF630_19430 [Cyanobacteria bacterium P01_C01_bin.38]
MAREREIATLIVRGNPILIVRGNPMFVVWTLVFRALKRQLQTRQN